MHVHTKLMLLTASFIAPLCYTPFYHYSLLPFLVCKLVLYPQIEQGQRGLKKIGRSFRNALPSSFVMSFMSADMKTIHFPTKEVSIPNNVLHTLWDTYQAL